MGCFGYICKGCGTPINGNCYNGGEKTIMIHVRHGEELGRVEGHYDEYGRVIEEEGLDENTRFRGDKISTNSHKEICESEFRLKDSHYRLSQLKTYKERECDFSGFVAAMVREGLAVKIKDFIMTPTFKLISEDLQNRLLTRVNELNESGIGEELLLCTSEIYHYETEIFDELYNNEVIRTTFNNLERVKSETYSGIIAWHSVCYKKATDEEKANLMPSDSDPNQSWGRVREKYK